MNREAPPIVVTAAGESPLERKLSYFFDLDLGEGERDALRELQQNTIPRPAHFDLIRAGDPFRAIYILREGWAIRYKDTGDGERIITNCLLPGDFVCLDARLFDVADYTVTTLTPVELAVISRDALMRILVNRPLLAVAFSWCTAKEESILLEHLLNIGRRRARARVAHLLLELWHRLRIVGRTGDSNIPLPMTQQELGDCLGLSHSHVNRVLARLRRGNLIEISANAPREIRILDAVGLGRIAEFDEGFLHLTGMPSYLSRFADRGVATGASDPTSEQVIR